MCRVVATEQASHDTWMTSHTKTLCRSGTGVTVILSAVLKRCCKGFSRKRCMMSKRVSRNWSKGWISFSVLGGTKVLH